MYSNKNHFSRGKKFNGGGSNRGKFSRANGGGKKGPKKQNINISRYINHNVAEKDPAVYEPKNSFADFGFVSRLADNLARIGYEKPSAIQDQAIPLVMNGQDVVGLANTGTGKTAAFLLPALNKLYQDRNTEAVLIVAPTRELAQQIDDEFRKFSAGMKLYSALCVGGVNINGQIRNLSRRPHVIIGTPGRLKDLINRKQLHLHQIQTFILDEADRMLDMGFVHDIREIASEIPAQHQTLCFSATITPGVRSIINDFMTNPTEVSVRIGETSEHIYQDVVRFTDKDHKREILVEMLTKEEFEKVIIFGETKFGVQRLADSLTREGITAVAIHGNKSQSQRERALKQFKTMHAKVLVATDVAARGLDIPNVSHVINYDTPQTYDDYVHRIGRTGRGGKTGKALTMIEDRRPAHNYATA